MTLPLRRILAGFLLVLLCGAVAACDAEAPGPSGVGSHPPTLGASNWQVLTVGGRAPQQDVKLTISFGMSTARGSGGCNEFGGSYQYEPSTGRIAFDQLAMTAMACVEAKRMELESAYVGALGRATQADLDPAGHLVLSGPAGVIVFAATAGG